MYNNIPKGPSGHPSYPIHAMWLCIRFLRTCVRLVQVVAETSLTIKRDTRTSRRSFGICVFMRTFDVRALSGHTSRAHAQLAGVATFVHARLFASVRCVLACTHVRRETHGTPNATHPPTRAAKCAT